MFFFHNMFACILKVVSVIREQSSHHSCVQTERTKQQQKRTGKVPKTDQSSKRRRWREREKRERERESSCNGCPWGPFNSHLSQVGNVTPKAQRESFYSWTISLLLSWWKYNWQSPKYFLIVLIFSTLLFIANICFSIFRYYYF